jgi:hypothetical protein
MHYLIRRPPRAAAYYTDTGGRCHRFDVAAIISPDQVEPGRALPDQNARAL